MIFYCLQNLRKRIYRHDSLLLCKRIFGDLYQCNNTSCGRQGWRISEIWGDHRQFTVSFVLDRISQFVVVFAVHFFCQLHFWSHVPWNQPKKTLFSPQKTVLLFLEFFIKVYQTFSISEELSPCIHCCFFLDGCKISTPSTMWKIQTSSSCW